jgi:hypothetical protein
MWAAVLVALILAGFVFYALASYHHHIVSTAVNLQTHDIIMVQGQRKSNNSKMVHAQEERKETGEGLYLFSELENGILYTYGMLLLISLPKFPSGWSLRVLTGWWWIYCILLVVAYRASMTAILANPTPRCVIFVITVCHDTVMTYIV